MDRGVCKPIRQRYTNLCVGRLELGLADVCLVQKELNFEFENRSRLQKPNNLTSKGLCFLFLVYTKFTI